MMKRGYIFLIILFFASSCSEETETAIADSVPAIDSTMDLVASADSVQVAIDTIALFHSSIHPICITDYWLTACATVIIRPPEFTDVTAFTKLAFRAWLDNQTGNGLMIYLGTDSAGTMFTVEVTQADASGYYFAYLYRRTPEYAYKYRTLLDSDLDCGPEPLDEEVSAAFNKRFDVVSQDYPLNELFVDPATTEVAKPGTMSNGEGSGYGELKMTLTAANGKVYRWFFTEGLSMCWSTYNWEVR